MTGVTTKVDPDVKIPAAVRAAAARSEELFNKLRDTPAEPPSEAPLLAGEEAPEVTSEGNPELDAKALKGEPEAKPKPETKPEVQSAEGEETWEHKYKSVYGRYVRAQEQVRIMSEQLKNLQGVVATMQAAAPATASAQSSDIPELSAERLVTDEEINDYGEDLLKVVGKRAREEIAPMINAYKAEITALKKQLDGVSGFVQQDTQQKLLSSLDAKLPNWRQVNTNQEFLDWLTLPDPYSGAIRHDMLKAAYAQGDAHRVLAFFSGFLAEEAAVTPAGEKPDPTVTKVPKIPLQDLAAPGRAKTAAAPNAPAEKPIITRAQVAEFYAKVASGAYRGKDDAKNRAEGEIFAAQREGRIR